MDQALFAVGLAEEAFATANLHPVFLVIGGLLVRQDVSQRCVGRQVEAPDLIVDFTDGPELARAIDLFLDVDRLQTRRESASLDRAVVLLDVLARPRDREVIEQGEIVEPEHLDQARGCAVGIVKDEPAIELGLGFAGGSFDAGDAVVGQSQVIAFRGERDLVAEVRQSIVHRRGRQHQHASLHPLPDDLAHQTVVAGFAILVRGLVAEIVRLVDDDKIVVAPVHMREVDVSRKATVPRQVRVVQNVVVEAVDGQDVAAVVALVQRPVVAQPLRTEHQDTIVAQFVVLDDRERLESLTETDTVGDDAAAEPVQFVDRTDHAVALELEELLPDDGVADTGRGIDDPILVQVLVVSGKQLVQGQRIDGVRVAGVRELPERTYQIGLDAGLGLKT